MQPEFENSGVNFDPTTMYSILYCIVSIQNRAASISKIIENTSSIFNPIQIIPSYRGTVQNMMWNQCILKSPWEPHRTASSLLNLTILALVAVVLQNYRNDAQRNAIQFLQGILFVCCTSIIKSMCHQKKKQEVCSIRLLPFGVQIEESLVDYDGNAKVEKKTFIPKESIIDVVVTEVALSYKLLSVVVFRLIDDENKKNGDDEMLKEASLVTAYDPNKMEMRYGDCISISQTLKSMLSIA